MLNKRNLDDLSVEELEKILHIKRRQSRIERFQRLSHSEHPISEMLAESVRAKTRPKSNDSSVGVQPLPTTKQRFWGRWKSQPTKQKRSKLMDRLLLAVELVALITLVGVIVTSYFSLQELNSEVSLAQQRVVSQELPVKPTAVPPIALARLPGGHSSPASVDGAMPDVPVHLQQWVQLGQTYSPAPIRVESSSQTPTRIVIPKINVDAPIVSGVTWEDLKKGVGHLPGSANPGERGNLYLAAHNDIYGEIFRYLDDLEVGDEYFIYASEQKFRYTVKEKRVIEPTEVNVMLPTTEPVATLQTCYPYLIDSHRLVVIGELSE
jgi:sortase A